MAQKLALSIPNYVRVVQSHSDALNSEYSVFNSRSGVGLKINFRAFRLLKKISGGNISTSSLLPTRGLLRQFVDFGIVKTQYSGEHNTTLATNKYNVANPLSSLSLELTDVCNLNCRHCYGSYAVIATSLFLPHKFIERLLGDLDRLQTSAIAITGGECTLHPDFVEIVHTFLERGYKVTVFSNGYNTEAISRLLKKTNEYHFSIKLSIDGLENEHNQIRGKQDAYQRSLATLCLLSNYSNVEVYVSSILLRNNIDSVLALRAYIAAEYPSITHTIDVGFPNNICEELFLTVKEIGELPVSILNRLTDASESAKLHLRKKQLRCLGGVTMATIDPSGNLRICNAAVAKEFQFAHNAIECGLEYSWIHCGNRIERFRHEKRYRTKDCLICSKANDCLSVDCRVQARAYTSDLCRSNPVTCLFANRANNTKRSIVSSGGA